MPTEGSIAWRCYWNRSDHRVRNCPRARRASWYLLGIQLHGSRMLHGHGGARGNGSVPASQEGIPWVCDTVRRPCVRLCVGVELCPQVRARIRLAGSAQSDSANGRYLIVTPNNINAAGVVIQYWTQKVHIAIWMGKSSPDVLFRTRRLIYANISQ